MLFSLHSEEMVKVVLKDEEIWEEIKRKIVNKVRKTDDTVLITKTVVFLEFLKNDHLAC